MSSSPAFSAASWHRGLLALGSIMLTACGGAVPHAHTAQTTDARPATIDAAVERDVASVRAATAAYRTLDSAVAAGYPRAVPRCLDHPADGAMGFHHLNRALLDDRIELERPEILLYSRTASGEYRLNGVEYIVPFTARSRDKEPPTVMAQKLKRSDELQLWYLHVWVWKANPKGLFADWNPAVKC